MAESVKVWVKTSVLDEIVHGKSLTTTKRSIPDPLNPDSGDSNQNWGWARGTVVADIKSRNASNSKDEGILGDGSSPVKIFIQDSDSSHDRNTIDIPGSAVGEGCVVMANIYPGDSDDEDDDYDDDYGGGGGRNDGCKYPDDLITLTHLHEPAVIYALRKRYALDKIYTSTGPILLAINPFKNCGLLYADTTMVKYRKRGEANMDMLSGRMSEEKKSDSGDDLDNMMLPPHVFAIADQSFRVMMSRLSNQSGGGGSRRTKTDAASGVNQSILVSGESGAGKTFTTKLIMKYLAQLSQTGTSNRNITSGAKSDGKDGIEKQVLQSNPILESFGNARTIRNDNSSRFGKYIEIQFSKVGTLTGASVKTYLLEKVRLVHQMPGERNYHIFYEILQGFTDEQFDKYFIGDLVAEDFKMISMSGTFDRRDGVEDFETYQDLKDAMDVMKFSDIEKDSIMAATCICLHALNLDFISISEDESQIDEQNEHLEAVLSLLGVSYEQLNKAICYFSIQAGRERHERSLSKEKAEKAMQGLVKAFYGALFNFLVHRVNSSITVKDAGGGGRGSRSRGGSGTAASIGVLDIFGFESFKVNSFEQLCINYCNETLQQQFNLFVLKNEQEEYEREGIKWSFISFPENQEVLDLIGKGNGKGIFSILDGQCRAPGTTDKTFANALYKSLTSHKRFEANFRQVGALKFGVIHYAGSVEYDTTGFVEKNKDEIPREATELLKNSSQDLVKLIGGILEDPTAPIGSIGEAEKKKTPTITSPAPTRGRAMRSASSRSVASSRQTVGGQFNAQLQELRGQIDLTAPHYVRCLKPNDLLVADHFDPVIIADQLRSAGVVEAVRVSRLGYPQRYSHSMFLNRYKVLALKELKRAAKLSKREKPVHVLVNAIALRIQSLEDEKNEKKEESSNTKQTVDLIAVGIQVGKTKVFLRQKAFDVIENFRSQKMVQGSIKIQTAARKYIGYRDYKIARKAIIKIQSQARSTIASRAVDFVRRNYNATVIQAKWRRTVQHERYEKTKIIAAWIQRMNRGRVGRRRYNSLNQIRKSIIIQKYWRRYRLKKSYLKMKESSLIIQCCVRSHFARNVLKELQAQARNLAAMSGERDLLRKENSTMKQRMEIMELKVKAAMAKVAEVEGSKEKMNELEAKNEELKQETDKLQKDLNEMGENLEKEIERSKSAEAKVQSTAEEYQSLSKETEELRGKIEDVEKSSEEAALVAQREVEKQNNEIDALKAQLKEVQDSNQVHMQESNAKEVALSEEIAALKGELDELNNEIREKNDAIETAERMASKVADESAAEMKSALDAALEEANEKHTAEINQLNADKEKMALELEEAKKTITDQADKIPSQDMVNSEELEQANKEIEDLKKELEVMQTKMKTESENAEKKIEESEKAKEEALEKVKAAAMNEDLMKELEEAKEAKDAALKQATASEVSKQVAESQLAQVEAEKNEVLQKLKIIEEEKEKMSQNITTPDNTAFQAISENIPQDISEALVKQAELQEKLSAAEAVKETLEKEVAVAVKEKEEAQKQAKKAKKEAKKLKREASDRASRADSSVVTVEKESNEQDNALLAVNSMLRKELEEITYELNSTKAKLQAEKENAKNDLEAFSEALKGVDELRHSAEIMGRELQRMKQKERRANAYRNNDYDDDDDDMTIVTVATTTLDNAAKVLNRHKTQQKQNHIWGKLKGFKATILSSVSENGF